MKKFMAIAFGLVSSTDLNASGIRCDEAICVVAERAVRGILRDPDSADFRKDSTCLAYVKGANRTFVIGEVNSSTAFGGKAGYQSYAYEASAGAFLIPEVPLANLCAKLKSQQ